MATARTRRRPGDPNPKAPTDPIDKLRQAHTEASRATSEALADIIHAADHAALVKSAEARKLFKKQEHRTLKAFRDWQKTADNLRKALRKQKANIK